MRGLRLLWLVAIPQALAAAAPGPETGLRFERDGALVRQLDLETLQAACGARVVSIERDPYYGESRRFHACPLGAVLALGFGGRAPGPEANGSGASFFLRARDGYERPASAERLAEPGAWLAFADADLTPGAEPWRSPRWQPIDRRQVDPGPFYLVWSGEGQDDPHRYPWPYQLVAIEWAPFEDRFPHTVPRASAAGSAARAGYQVFRRDCIACHAVNGEGGTVGPDLNVPRSIVEYRPAEQIKAFVRDPAAFRYTSMPAHPHLSEADLDALLAYFRAMSGLKRDPRAEASGAR